jgi:AhpD family alkylhydroperoxidase
MDYAKISKETFDLLYKARASLNHSPLSASIRVLAELRVSQINGCAYCCRLHSEEARRLGIAQEKLDALPAWRTSTSFTEEENLVLQWVESVTHLDDHLDAVKEQLLKMYSERQLVDLSATISIMNALNRIAVSLRD